MDCETHPSPSVLAYICQPPSGGGKLVSESTVLTLVLGYRHMICFSVLNMGFGTEYRVRIRVNSARAPGVTEVVASTPLGVYSTTCMGYIFRFSGWRFRCLCFCVESKVVSVLVHSVDPLYWISLPAGMTRMVWTSIVTSRVGLKLIRIDRFLPG